MSEPGRLARIVVLAGVNGAGKSSIAGAALRRAGADYLNPDEATRRILDRHPELLPDEANSRAWLMSRDRIIEAIRTGQRFAFETTLGGRTITGILLDAARAGVRVRMFYVGLGSVDKHIARVRARVRRGGHDIPEERIRARYDSSRRNLIRLLPHLDELSLWDNSTERDPVAGKAPEPVLILHTKGGQIVHACPPAEVPQWAKPIVQAAIQTGSGGSLAGDQTPDFR